MPLQTFAVGLIGLIVGIAFGTFLGYGITFEAVHAFLTSPATYGWAAAIGATGAALVAVGVGVSQHNQTKELREESISIEEKREKERRIFAVCKTAGTIEDAISISNVIIKRLNMFECDKDITFNLILELYDEFEKRIDDQLNFVPEAHPLMINMKNEFTEQKFAINFSNEDEKVQKIISHAEEIIKIANKAKEIIVCNYASVFLDHFGHATRTDS